MTKKRERDIDDIGNSSSVKKCSTSSDTLNVQLLTKEIAEIIANNDEYSKVEIDNKRSHLLLRAIKGRKLDCVDLLLRHKDQVILHFCQRVFV